jgi:hypothetical protein
MGQHYCAAHLLIGVPGINTQFESNFNCLVKFSGGTLLHQGNGLGRRVEFLAINELSSLLIPLTSFCHSSFLLCGASGLHPPTNIYSASG